MDGQYDIMLGGRSVGKVKVARQGLYVHFSCRCDFSGEVVYRIQVRCGEKTENLGVPVPQNGAFELQKQIPAKHLGDGTPEFRAVPKHAALDERFIPLSPEEPFRYLRRLQEAHLQIRDGQVGVVIPH